MSKAGTSTDRHRSILVIGDVLIDELRSPAGVSSFPGGSALNVAVGLTRLGQTAVLAGVLSGDAEGRRIRRHLAEHGVEVIGSPAPLGSPRATSERVDGEPTYRFNGAARARHIEFGSRLRATAETASMVAVSGFPFDDDDQVAALLEIAQGRPLVLDPNPRVGLVWDLDAYAEGLLAAAAHAELVKIGDDDAALVFDADASEVASRLQGAGARRVLVTRGANGARLLASDLDVAVPVASAPGPVIDTMGAGDATFAAFIASMAAQPGRVDWTAASRRAMSIAAATVRQPGGLLQLPT